MTVPPVRYNRPQGIDYDRLTIQPEAARGMMAIGCPHCKVAPGEWCVTTSGKRAVRLHANRYWRWACHEGA